MRGAALMEILYESRDFTELDYHIRRVTNAAIDFALAPSEDEAGELADLAEAQQNLKKWLRQQRDQ